MEGQYFILQQYLLKVLLLFRLGDRRDALEKGLLRNIFLQKWT